MLDYILGVDGGGTKTVIRIADTTGKTVSEHICGAGNYKSVGIESAEENINKGIFTAMAAIDINAEGIYFRSSCFGLSGLDCENDKAIFAKMIFNGKFKKLLDNKKTILCNDSRIGLSAASDNRNGIMIICGTGSNCFGINEYGKEAKANGWDFILGDEGSGYDTGIKALKAVMRAYDKRGPKTILTQKILQELNLGKTEELIEWAYSSSFSSGRFAALAKIVCEAAKQEDKVSIKILNNEVREAFISISTVASRLDISKKDFDIVFVGSLFRCEKYFKNVLEAKLKARFPNIIFKPFNDKPVSGAIKLALRNL